MMPTAAPVDYLARIPLTVDRTEYCVRIFSDPALPGPDAAAQVNSAIAALVAMAVEEDRAARRPVCPACGGRGERGVFCSECPPAVRAAGRADPSEVDMTDALPPAPSPSSGASWASRVAQAMMPHLEDDSAVRLVAERLANQVLGGSLAHLEWVDRHGRDADARASEAVAKAASDVNPC
jgi:hypothetical protein